MSRERFRKPLIGLPARMDPGQTREHLSRSYSDAVLDAGGLPVIIPLVDTPRSLTPFAAGLDGILLTGSGSDVDPACYSAAREPVCGPVQPLRDRTDFMLLEAAGEHSIPVLAICFGMQSLNVFRGGTLIQDIATHVHTTIRHNNPSSNGKPCHAAEIAPGCALEELAGGARSQVNSTHHQAVARCGRGLEVIARAPDGVVEAVAGSDLSHWVLGVQWHPEKSHAIDAFSRRIFDFFIAACISRMGDR